MTHSRLAENKPNPILPLQGLQRTICTFEQFNEGTNVYHEAYKIELAGNLNIPRLQQALEKMLLRHPALCSRFTQTDDKIFVQEFLPPKTILEQLPFKVIDTSQYDETTSLSTPFALDKAPLWRAILVKKDKNQYDLVMVFHHLIYDGTSNEIFKKDLARFYNEPTLTPVTIPVSPAIQTDDYFAANMLYWQDTLKDTTPLDVKSDLNPEQKFCFRGSRQKLELDEKTVEGLKQLSTQTGITPNTLLLACFYIWLHRVTGENDICIGTASANRKRSNVNMDEMFNCFFNSVLLRLKITDKSYMELAQEIRVMAKEAYAHQIPLDIISKKLTNRVNTFFVLHPPKSKLQLNGITSSEPIDLDLQHSRFINFGVNLFQSENGKIFTGFVEFNRDKFSPEFIARFISHFQTIIKTVVAHPQTKISEIDFLSETEKDNIGRLNDTNKPCTTQDYMHQLFAKLAEKTPDAKAFVFHETADKNTCVTYQEAEQKSNILAAHLYQNKVQPNTCVGICLPRSPNLMTAMLATLKAGGTIVPLETNPEEWRLIFYKLEQTNPQLIIVDNSTKELFAEYAGPELNLVNLDDQVNHSQQKFPLPNLQLEDTAYIMFTSGTTGKRKGVKISHRNMLNATNAVIDRNYPKGSRVLSTAPPTFDCFFFEWLEALVTRGTVHFIQGMGQFNPTTITQIMNQEQLNLATLTPNIIEKLERKELPTSLCDLISMGDYPRRETIQAFQGVIRNEYGLTQAGIFSTNNICQPEDPHTCIGTPIRNTKIFILDQYKHICPPSFSGKIFIAGESLGCYLDEKLTQDKYVVYKFNKAEFCFTLPCDSTKESKSEDVLLYDTGDIGAYLPTKHGYKLDFKSRSDRKIKLHSALQVHLGEVESALLQSKEMKEVTVTYDANNGLTAYFVPMISDKNFSTKELNDQLRKTPILSAIRLQRSLQVESIPLNSNGKVNYAKLAELKIPPEPIVQPTTELQKLLRKIWADTLAIPEDKISMDHFYNELGGNSISVPTIAAAINNTKLLGKDITNLRTLFPSFELNISILDQEKLLIPLLKKPRLTCIYAAGHFKKPSVRTVYLHKEQTTPKKNVF